MQHLHAAPSRATIKRGPKVKKKAVTVQNKNKKDTRAQFIFKLHKMISTEGGNIVEWTSDGSAFLIKNPDLFATHLLPKYCGHKTFTSFERQMNFYRYVFSLSFLYSSKNSI
jgi:hypothetical protein